MKKILIIIISFFVLLIALFYYFFMGTTQEAKKIVFGIDFSQKHAQNLGLDWRETYLALLDELNVKNIKIDTYWDFLEPQKDDFRFDDLDWQIKKATEREVSIVLVIGMKTPRWPECHIPTWAKDFQNKEREERILNLIRTIVTRYRQEDSIWAWQVENEPFFAFGECPKISGSFLKKEVNLVKDLDFKNRPVIISDTGEWSFWVRAGFQGDIVGTTLYRKIWSSAWGSYYPNIWPPIFYQRRAQLIKKILGKDVMCTELQLEPWGPKLIYDLPLEEQEQTMNLQIFKENVEFAKKTGLDKFYLWGGEWWFWLKEKYNKPEIWEEAKKLFKQ